MKSKLMLLAFLCFLTKLSLGQDTVITIYGDTLRGSYDIQRGFNGSESVKVDIDNGDKETYKIHRIKRIEDENGDVYEPIQIDRYITFGKKIKEGYVSLYYYTEDGNTVRFNQSILVKTDGSILKVPGFIGFRNSMAEFLSECAEVQLKLKDKVYGKSDLFEILDEYNVCVEEKTQIILTEQTTQAEQSEVKAELSTQFESFRTALDKSTTVENKKEALDMFNDFADKLANGENIPSYLSNALKQAVSTDKTLTDILKDLLEQ